MLALSIVIIFRSTDTVNFAIGDMGTSGLFVAGTLFTVEQPVAFGLLIHAGIFVGWGTCPRPFPALVGGTVTVFGIALAWNKIVAAAIALLAIAGVAWFFKKTPFGNAMRATANDPGAARIIDINAGRVAAIAWFVGCGMVAIAACFLAADSALSPSLTLSALFRAFAGVFLSGPTSMSGAVIGGFVIGIVDNVAGRYISASFRDTIVFTVIVVVLFIRPSGVLGAGRKERV